MRIFLPFFLVTAVALLPGCSKREPKAEVSTQVPPAPQPPAFNGERAFEYLLKQTSFGPRNPGSMGHTACLSYLSNTLQSFADSLQLQEFTHEGYGGESLHLTNIIASWRPADRERILLCAHWDTRPRADQDENPQRRNEPILGANDGASGVAILMHLASLLKTTPPPVGVDIALFDGEDYGREGDTQNYLLGARHFARTIPQGYLPRFAILLDMVGDARLELPREANSVRLAPDVVDLVWNTARQLGRGAFLNEIGEAILDDHMPLNEAGIKTIDIIDFNYPDATNRFWHTHNDIAENCSPASLLTVGDVVTHVLYSQRP
jgi:glutaminyl-peptide cyclotransferase